MAFIFFIGGTHSGKSKLAQAWAEAAAPERVLLTTCHSKDPKLAARLAEHRKSSHHGWDCLEEPLEPLGALQAWRENRPDFNGSFVIDSLGLWIANLMTQNLPISGISRRIAALAEVLAQPDYSCAVVSEECGLGFGPLDAIGRKYSDILGSANQIMAKNAHAAIFVSCGLPLALKGTIPAVLERYTN